MMYLEALVQMNILQRANKEFS
ncbi:hypothetical protein NC652_039419 [Populus alba x Populus x berolinensis]|uniref:Uncharacterized protein n=1 Tax=Populus alba x Populus x berolinensis TaxID=444605 RepID=A0AAD6LDR2_9ROSI|nr:hypothetical protein NC652_038891 [Populus alba x Populus x berolinensis]KAJ6861907.1 hypothetical protein NC652_038894 [Populus alba x Populus x berolinensis]KAJ6862559.1 hypothetical protein NC652_039415 [Populus alba x Populus x berolinensis]KAJ6862563.1 hypothetical protein NC652_039419 [Populus alba x Populus x berolinensis]KAJ6957456.1 hypothetical protein NC653_039416 [Populus alba x Populus x berolinensis]